MNKTQIKELLQKYNLKPNKTMGQNFLINEHVLEKIIKAADLDKNDLVLEVGSGLGTLTKELAKKARKVITIEKDKQMTEALKQELKDYENIEIIYGDALDKPCVLRNQGRASKMRPSAGIAEGAFERHGLRLIRKHTASSYKVVANIPYYLTSHLIRLLLESENQPEQITLLVQKQVAQRICIHSRRTGQVKMNLLAVSVQFYGKPKIISYVSKESFWPKPKVDSAIIKITEIKKPENINVKKFFKLVKAGFSSPRKQLVNNLSSKLNLDKQEIKKALAECGLDIQTRAENLSIKDWVCLTSPSGHDPTKSPGRL